MSSRTLNKVSLIGNLGNDPKVNQTQSGSFICSFRLATDRSWTVKSTGEKKEKTQWHQIVAFGKLAEICQKILKKGTKVFISGRLQTTNFVDQQGNEVPQTEIVARQIEAFDNRKTYQDQEPAYQTQEI